MIAGIYNITCEQGSTFTRTFTILQNDGTVYDLTGFSARMQIRRDYDSTTPIFTASILDGHITMSVLFGEIHVDIPASTTATFARDGVYDLEIFNADGVVYKVVKGIFRLNLEVTR